MSYLYPVPNSAALPATGNTTGDVRVALDTGVIYKWSGSAWVSQSSIAPVNAIPPLITPLRRYVNFVDGNDANDGSENYPWKTLQHAYNSISPTINEPYSIFLSGGNNDSDGAIVAKPNVSLIADYQIQVGSGGFTITGGSTNDGASFTNIIFVGAFSWVRNDTSAIGCFFYSCSFFSGPTLQQQGAGTCGVQAFNSVFVNANFQLQAFGFFVGCSFLGATTTFPDGANSAVYIQFSGCYNSTAMSIAGPVSPVYLSGMIQDVPFGAAMTFTTTGNGTPSLEMDSAGVPQTYTGSPTPITLLSKAIHESYSPGTPANWSSPPTNVAQALDQIAAKIGPV